MTDILVIENVFKWYPFLNQVIFLSFPAIMVYDNNDFFNVILLIVNDMILCSLLSNIFFKDWFRMNRRNFIAKISQNY